ncbi:hypothetical protein R3P38DRAFT_3206301 [Favolaschia claudopus]|uniref:F-box domain-containing protein n=1 Tax=Favolaschia claudopus TaxID=2862362 RepID=A0AAW0ALS4_9AGAR
MQNSASRHLHTDSGSSASRLQVAIQLAGQSDSTGSDALPPEIGGSRNVVSVAGTSGDALTHEQYVAQSCGVSALVQRLPTELLADIFDMCFPEEMLWIDNSITAADEVRRLSQHHLLQLGQVCSRWHAIAMCTPKLWSTLAFDINSWRKFPIPNSAFLTLLESSLTRGGDHPLTLRVGTRKGLTENRDAITLLYKHAQRWQSVHFSSNDRCRCKSFSDAVGNLEQLHHLSLNVSWKRVDIFARAPRLKSLTLRARKGIVGDLSTLPWQQIERCECIGTRMSKPHLLYFPLSVLQRAQSAAEIYLSLTLRSTSVSQTQLFQVSSNAREVEFELDADTPQLIGQLFDCLTLPCLESYDFYAAGDDLPPWPSEAFLALADRSKFADHLTRLSICAIISDVELVRCLKVLPRLEELSLWDGWPTESMPVPNIVITDTFLRALLFKEDEPYLVPSLGFLYLVPRLEFSDSVLLDVVNCRIEELGSDDGDECPTFQVKLFWQDPLERSRDVSAETLEQLQELVSEGRLLFYYGEASEFDF